MFFNSFLEVMTWVSGFHLRRDSVLICNSINNKNNWFSFPVYQNNKMSLFFCDSYTTEITYFMEKMQFHFVLAAVGETWVSLTLAPGCEPGTLQSFVCRSKRALIKYHQTVSECQKLGYTLCVGYQTGEALNFQPKLSKRSSKSFFKVDTWKFRTRRTMKWPQTRNTTGSI